MGVRLPLAAAAAALVLTALGPAPTPAVAAASASSGLLVRFAAAVPSASALASSSGLRIRSVRRLGARSALVTARAEPGAAAHGLRTVRGVEGVAVDRRVRLAGAPAPFRSGAVEAARQWDLWDARSRSRAGGYGIDAARAWTRTLGSPDVVVAVLDTGITAHPALAGARVAAGYDFVSGGDGVASGDGDGWDADPSDPGDACVATGERSSWHGTFVTGEIAAQRGGSTAGAAPGVTVMPVRVLGGCGGAESDTVAAITWASGGEVPGVPVASRRADVLSMSLGSADGACPAALQAAVDGAVARGTTVVAAAGNDGGDMAESSPANCRGVLAVAASTRSGRLAAYSNRGAGGSAPALAAPGGTRADPVLGAGWSSASGLDEAGNRAVVVAATGTSMAAPHAASAAALLLSGRPGLTPSQVVSRLTSTATRFPAASGCRPAVCGAGIVNAGNAVGASKRFVRVGDVRLTGPARQGHLLVAPRTGWIPVPQAVRYRWLRDGEPIAGATSHTYRVRGRDVRHRISVRTTVRRSGVAAASSASGSLLARPA